MTIFMPAVFQDIMQSPEDYEDYYERYHFATAVRFLRYLAIIISLVLPSFYIAVITFHQEMVPTQLLISIAASREGVPFPTVVEALILAAVMGLFGLMAGIMAVLIHLAGLRSFGVPYLIPLCWLRPLMKRRMARFA